MNKEAMQQLILEALSQKLGSSFHIRIQQFLKANQKLDGLTIQKEGDSITPVIYLEPFYQVLENGTSVHDIVKDILQIYSSTRMYPNHFDVTSIQNFDYVKERLYVQLVNRHMNRELLQDIPHSLFLDDFAVTVRCMVAIQAEENASFLVHHGHLGMWQVGQEELMAHALQNTRELFGLCLRNMNDFMKEFFSHSITGEIPDTSLWIMTNSRQLHGAATALFDDVLKEFAHTHGDFFVIFSSVHEILLLPTSDSSAIDEITKMNREVNATQMLEDEILGTKAYYYSRENGFVL